MDTPQPPSRYLDYLPAIFRQEPEDGRQEPFVGQFLRAFETVLSGAGGKPGLETTISGIANSFDPDKAERDFLPWLAGWVALSLRANWDEQTRRAFIKKIVPLYKLRGTRVGLLQMLNLYTSEPVEIYDTFDNQPYFFEVRLTLSVADPDLFWTKQQIARAIIDQEKPAHTYYALRIAVPTLRLPGWILGRENSMLGTERVSPEWEDPNPERKNP